MANKEPKKSWTLRLFEKIFGNFFRITLFLMLIIAVCFGNPFFMILMVAYIAYLTNSKDD